MVTTQSPNPSQILLGEIRAKAKSFADKYGVVDANLVLILEGACVEAAVTALSSISHVPNSQAFRNKIEIKLKKDVDALPKLS